MIQWFWTFKYWNIQPAYEKIFFWKCLFAPSVPIIERSIFGSIVYKYWKNHHNTKYQRWVTKLKNFRLIKCVKLGRLQYELKIYVKMHSNCKGGGKSVVLKILSYWWEDKKHQTTRVKIKIKMNGMCMEWMQRFKLIFEFLSVLSTWRK